MEILYELFRFIGNAAFLLLLFLVVYRLASAINCFLARVVIRRPGYQLVAQKIEKFTVPLPIALVLIPLLFVSLNMGRGMFDTITNYDVGVLNESMISGKWHKGRVTIEFESNGRLCLSSPAATNYFPEDEALFWELKNEPPAVYIKTESGKLVKELLPFEFNGSLRLSDSFTLERRFVELGFKKVCSAVDTVESRIRY